ncbi:MAG: response regulator [Deltaproteobacteria bacterium]|jgi:DNA-binding response OmpR family regulator|nr:response regulator [Deltaproteobacteria bacterium]
MAPCGAPGFSLSILGKEPFLPRPRARVPGEKIMDAKTRIPNPRILIVDDDELIHKLLGAILQKAGFDCLDALSGQEALEKAQKERPELVILDIMMPEMDGFEVMRALKSNPITSSIPVIFLSGKFHNREKAMARELGAADFMEKPFERSELLARVKTYLTLRRQEDNISFYNESLVNLAREALGILSRHGSKELTNLPVDLANNLDASYKKAQAAFTVIENQWVVFSAFVKPYLAGQGDSYYRESLALIPNTMNELKEEIGKIGSVSRELQAICRPPLLEDVESPQPKAPSPK